MVQVKLVGCVGHAGEVAAGLVQVAQVAEALSGMNMLVLGEQLSEGKFAPTVGEGVKKFVQVVAGQEGSLKLAQGVMVMVA